MAVGTKKVRRTARDRRKLRIRKIVTGSNERPRLSVYKSSKCTYAQIITDQDNKTLLSVSSRDAEVISAVKALSEASSAEGKKPAASAKSILSAFALGKVLAGRAIEKKLSSVVFDRNGFLYHGRIKALADGAREGGLKF